jgi:hypothetical protein
LTGSSKLASMRLLDNVYSNLAIHNVTPRILYRLYPACELP